MPLPPHQTGTLSACWDGALTAPSNQGSPRARLLPLLRWGLPEVKQHASLLRLGLTTQCGTGYPLNSKERWFPTVAQLGDISQLPFEPDAGCHARRFSRVPNELGAGSTGLTVTCGPKLNNWEEGREVVARGPQKYRANKHVESGRTQLGRRVLRDGSVDRPSR